MFAYYTYRRKIEDAEEPDIYQLPIPSNEEYLDFARQYPGEYEVPEEASSGDSFEYGLFMSGVGGCPPDGGCETAG